MSKLIYDKAELLSTIDRIVKRTEMMDLSWDWPCGVAYYGISKAYEATKNEEYLNFLKERIDELISLGLPTWTINTCAMGHSLITLYQATNDKKYYEILLSKIDFLKHKALRFGSGTLQHTVSSKNDFPEQAWADTLFMAAFFMLRFGVISEDKELINDALNQYVAHIKYLQDKQTGLWYHGYNNIQKDHMSSFYWARANAWASYTMSQVNLTLPEAYFYPQYMDVWGSLDEMLCSLKFYQTENGLFRTILDDETSYEELSASAGIAAAFLENKNPLHLKYVNKAYKGILPYIDESGKVNGVSAGTAVMKDSTGYKQISRVWIQGWGQGLVLAFFSALLTSNL